MKTENHFKEICKLVGEGFTVLEACDELGLYHNNFCESLNRNQKLELNQLKAANKRSNANGENSMSDLHEFFTSNDYAY